MRTTIAVAFLLLALSANAELTIESLIKEAGLTAGDDPARWHRVFWAFALGLMPVALMLLEGNLRPIQVILLIVSLPILFVGIAMTVSLVKALRADHPAA